MKTLLLLPAALAAAVSPPSEAMAQVLVHGLTATNSLVTFLDRGGPVVAGPVLSGLGAREQVLSLDVRPFTGALYAVSRDAEGVGRLYTVAPDTGALTAVPLAGAAFTLSGVVDVDFNPAALSGTNALRIVTSGGQNFRLVFTAAGATVNVDGAINGAVGGMAELVATAYTRNSAGLPGGGGVGGTAQYALDAGTDTLYRVNPPNNGTLTEPKPVGVDFGYVAAMDIVTGSDRALALLQVGDGRGLYEIDLATGTASKRRELPGNLVSLAAELPVVPPGETAFGLAATNRLVRFSLRGGDVQAGPAVTGLGVDEMLVGIDFRPLDGKLYGVTRDAAGLGRLYTLDPIDGVAMPVALAGPPLLLAANVGMDFNPVAVSGANALRLLSSDGQNYRLVFGAAGATVNVDGAVNVADTGPVPRVTATAYSNNRGGLPGGGGVGGTVQYAIDAATASLYRVNPPNNGTLTERRSLPFGIGALAGLDVLTGSDRLVALLEVAGEMGIYELDGRRGLLGWVRGVPADVVDIAVPMPVILGQPQREGIGLGLVWSGGVGPFEVWRGDGVDGVMTRVLTTRERAGAAARDGVAGFFRISDQVGGGAGTGGGSLDE